MINEAMAAVGVSRYIEQEGNVTVHRYSLRHLDCRGYTDHCLQRQVESGVKMVCS